MPPDDGRRLVITDVDTAVDRLRAGGVVAVPTETVYGLAADAENPAAVARIFEVKGRPAGHPLIVHLADAGQLADWAALDPPRRPVSSPRRAGRDRSPCSSNAADRVLDVVTGGRPAVGIRVPVPPD